MPRLPRQAPRLRDLIKSRRFLTVTVTLVAAVILLLGLRRPVTVLADGRQVTVRTLSRTVAGALRAAHVKTAPNDLVLPAPGTVLAKGQPVSVVRARPLTVILPDGTSHVVASAAGDAAGILRDGNLAVDGEVRARVSVDRSRPERLTVRVVSVRTEVVTQQEKVAFRTERRETASLELGIEKVVQTGVTGLKEVQYRITYENGKVVQRQVITSTMLKEPVTRLVAVGTSGTTVTRGGETIRFKRAFLMSATGYTAGPESTGKYATGYTYLGMKASYGVVAVDPHVIPLRSRLYIEGYGFAIAGDIGGAIKGNRIDLCFDTVSEALQWGRRTVKVYIIE